MKVGGIKKKRTAIDASVKAYLTAFFAHTPYPTADEVASLATEARLTQKVVKGWFQNRRRRRSPTATQADESADKSADGPLVISCPPSPDTVITQFVLDSSPDPRDDPSHIPNVEELLGMCCVFLMLCGRPIGSALAYESVGAMNPCVQGCFVHEYYKSLACVLYQVLRPAYTSRSLSHAQMYKDAERYGEWVLRAAGLA